MGLFTYSFLKLFLKKRFKLKLMVLMLCSGLLFIILKPYILAVIICPLTLFVMGNHLKIKRLALFYILALVIVYAGSIITLKYAFHKDVINTIVVRQNDFISLTKGGIFFVNEQNYLRLDYKETKEFAVVDSTKNICRIMLHTKLMYWDLDHIRDTVFISDNKDTSLYTLIATNKPAGSGIHMDRLNYSFSSFAKLLPVSFYNVLCRPFFFDAHSAAEIIASMENLLFLLFFIICFIFRTPSPVNRNLLCFCAAVVLLSFFLIGITTTVAGAIVRYKVPCIPFLLMIPLLYLDTERLKKIPFIKRLLN